ncbi:S8 family peptidase [Metabacillus arenae]|uniref:S8 family peptidase n=1 Tax=Metabacillus arenae TaxID=2771434 RepID=A0A926NEZ5_9BACI|nr:S8 family peptidase [Metabacillus arenae]MBD1380319.1 S8 family peptidase [Metabacillus arenae]
MEKKMHLVPYLVEEVVQQANEIPQGVDLIQAPKMWSKGYTGKSVTIAVLDTGCDIEHPDLSHAITGGRNFTDDDGGNPSIYRDYNGHGTHVAGTIAAKENESGVVGVAPDVNLLILKVLAGKEGSGAYEWITNAINYAVDQKVDIITMSLGGPDKATSLHQAIKRAVKENILVVCAAGNNGDNNHQTSEFSYPAGYNEVISVGAINFERKSSYFTNSNNEIDLVAPGENILSSIPDGKYASYSGTSMAAPHVAGSLALIKNQTEDQFERKFSEPELYSQLIKRTLPLGHPNSLEGNGLVYLTTPDLLEEQARRLQVRTNRRMGWF